MFSSNGSQSSKWNSFLNKKSRSKLFIILAIFILGASIIAIVISMAVLFSGHTIPYTHPDVTDNKSIINFWNHNDVSYTEDEATKAINWEDKLKVKLSDTASDMSWLKNEQQKLRNEFGINNIININTSNTVISSNFKTINNYLNLDISKAIGFSNIYNTEANKYVNLTNALGNYIYSVSENQNVNKSNKSLYYNLVQNFAGKTTSNQVVAFTRNPDSDQRVLGVTTRYVPTTVGSGKKLYSTIDYYSVPYSKTDYERYTGEISDNFKQGWFSTSDPSQVFIHEIGHAISNYLFFNKNLIKNYGKNAASSPYNTWTHDCGNSPNQMSLTCPSQLHYDSNSNYLLSSFDYQLLNSFSKQNIVSLGSNTNATEDMVFAMSALESNYARQGFYSSQKAISGKSGYFLTDMAEYEAESFAYWFLNAYELATSSKSNPYMLTKRWRIFDQFYTNFLSYRLFDQGTNSYINSGSHTPKPF